MISDSLLEILCCPETHQPLRVAEAALVTNLNEQIKANTLKNRAGKPVTGAIDEGLVRQDRKFLYPVRHNIPVLLIDEAIPLS
jgi:uncharacterized protein